MRSRWQFLKESQLRKDRGIAFATIVALATVAGLYDLGVAQLARDPDKWVRIRDVIGFLPWYIWVLMAMLGVMASLFEGGYRATANRDLKALQESLSSRQHDNGMLADAVGAAVREALRGQQDIIWPSIRVPIPPYGEAVLGPITEVDPKNWTGS